MTKNYTKKIGTAVAALAMVGSFVVAVPAFAADTNAAAQINVRAGIGGPGQGVRGEKYRVMGSSTRPMMARPTAVGTVTGISGSIITINSRKGLSSTTPVKVLTVDATNATVIKNNATSSLASIVAGDTIVVQGTLSGTNVVATSIHDGVMRNSNPMMEAGRGRGGMASSTLPMGNGQPVIAGTVSVINGSSLTITTKSNVTYTVDASAAKILNGNQAATISNVTVGDSVIVQGTVNGTSVVATSVVDQSHKANNGQKTAPKGFFGGIGQFFSRIFGF